MLREIGGQRARRGGKDEGSGAIDEKFAQDHRHGQQAALAAQRLAAGAQDDHIFLSPQVAGKTDAPLAKNTDGMGLVNHQHGVMTVGKAREIGQRRPVAIHAVQALDGDPDRARTAFCAPGPYFLFERVAIIMREWLERGSPQFHAIMDAGVNERVIEQQVTGLRQGCEQCGVGGESGAEEQAGFCTIMAGRKGFERFMFGVTAAEEA